MYDDAESDLKRRTAFTGADSADKSILLAFRIVLYITGTYTVVIYLRRSQLCICRDPKPANDKMESAKAITTRHGVVWATQ